MDAKSLASVSSLLDLTSAANGDVLTFNDALPGLLEMVTPAGGAGGPGTIGVSVGISAAQVITTQTQTNVLWDKSIVAPSSYVSHTLGTALFTINTSGTYRVSGVLRIKPTVNAPWGHVQARLYQNATELVVSDTMAYCDASGEISFPHPLDWTGPLVAGDVIKTTIWGRNNTAAFSMRAAETTSLGIHSTLCIKYEGA